jgi:peptidoglycan L-alanyl-D-glutamate endopeptidase CwlK
MILQVIKFNFYMDPISLKRIALLHPKLRQDTLLLYNYVNSKVLGKGVRLRLTYTVRSFKEQDDLYALGRTKVNPDGKSPKKPMGNIVTKASAGFSFHNYALAFDIVLLVDNGTGKFDKISWDRLADYDKDLLPDWTEVANYFKFKGWTWGGDFKNFKDYPHFQKTFGFSESQLLQKWNNGDTFKEVIDGVTYKYVNL